MTIDAGFVQWLKAAARFASASDATVAARWGARAVSTEAISPLAAEADTIAEAARQAAFFAGPLVRDTHVVAGARVDLFGRAVRLRGDRLGYEGAGAVAFVIRAQEADDGATTALTVLRKLA